MCKSSLITLFFHNFLFTTYIFFKWTSYSFKNSTKITAAAAKNNSKTITTGRTRKNLVGFGWNCAIFIDQLINNWHYFDIKFFHLEYCMFMHVFNTVFISFNNLQFLKKCRYFKFLDALILSLLLFFLIFLFYAGVLLHLFCLVTGHLQEILLVLMVSQLTLMNFTNE